MVHLRTPWGFQEIVNELDRVRQCSNRVSATDSVMSVAELKVSADVVSFSVDLPGVELPNLKITLEDDQLRIEAQRVDPQQSSDELLLNERGQGEFSRTFQLPWPVNPQDVEASLEKGVLSITLKKAPEAGPHEIKIQSK